MTQNLSVPTIVGMLSEIGASTTRVRGKRFREQGRWQLPLDEFKPSDYSVPEEGTCGEEDLENG